MTLADIEIGIENPFGRLVLNFPIGGVIEKKDVLGKDIAPFGVPKPLLTKDTDNGFTDAAVDCVLILLSNIEYPSVALPVYEKTRFTNVPGLDIGDVGRP